MDYKNSKLIYDLLKLDDTKLINEIVKITKQQKGFIVSIGPLKLRSYFNQIKTVKGIKKEMSNYKKFPYFKKHLNNKNKNYYSIELLKSYLKNVKTGYTNKSEDELIDMAHKIFMKTGFYNKVGRSYDITYKKLELLIRELERQKREERLNMNKIIQHEMLSKKYYEYYFNIHAGRHHSKFWAKVRRTVTMDAPNFTDADMLIKYFYNIGVNRSYNEKIKIRRFKAACEIIDIANARYSTMMYNFFVKFESLELMAPGSAHYQTKNMYAMYEEKGASICMKHGPATNIYEERKSTRDKFVIDRIISGVDVTSITPIYSGFQFIYSSSSNLRNGTSANLLNAQTNAKKILRAFKPSNNPKFHAQTTASTGNQKLCIYETFLDMIEERPLIYRRNKQESDDELMNKLKEEGEEIYNNVIEGDLLGSLSLLTLKYKFPVLINFFNSNKHITVCGKKIRYEFTDEELKVMDGCKCMLYDEEKQHVAPAFYKYINNLEFELKKEESREKFTLNPIELKKSVKNVKYDIYAYDIETYTDNDNFNQISFCICLYGCTNVDIREHFNLDKENCELIKAFYGKNCLKEFGEYIDSISDKTKYFKSKAKKAVKDIIIFSFNGSRFDNMLIYNELHDLNKSTQYVFADNSIKQIKYNNITILDIQLFYNDKLCNVAECFKLKISKSVFPYSFPKEDNLNYIGEVPQLKFWNSEDDMNEYIKENGNTFDLENYTKKYCILDCKLTYQIARLHLNQCVGIENDKFFNTALKSTGASLAMALFQQVFQKKILVGSNEIELKKEKEAYCGGRTEVFKKKFISDGTTKLYYYDRNSSYPASMTQMMPYQYLRTIKLKNMIYDMTNIDELEDYYLYSVKYKYMGNDEHHIPNLLQRTDKGRIIAVKECDKFTYKWGIEIKNSIKNNYEIIINEVNQYIGDYTFKEYAESLYAKRLIAKKDNAALSAYLKLCLNSLYGKMGQKPHTTKIIVNHPDDAYNIISDKGIIKSFTNVNDKFFVEYVTLEDDKSIYQLTRFASYIAACARTALADMMDHLGHSNIYYCDTDSVFTTQKPDACYISQDKLGLWKNEYGTDDNKNYIVEAHFLAPKCYTYTKPGNLKTFINKTKGLKGDDLDHKELIQLSNGEVDNVTQEKPMFFRSFENIKVKPQVRTLMSVFNKRIWTGDISEAYQTIEDFEYNLKVYEKERNEIKKENKLKNNK